MSAPIQDSINNSPRGAQIVQTNTISTPVFVVLVVALFVAAAISSISVGMAFNANYAAQLAERAAAVARNHADNLETRVIALENAANIDQRSKN